LDVFRIILLKTTEIVSNKTLSKHNVKILFMKVPNTLFKDLGAIIHDTYGNNNITI